MAVKRSATDSPFAMLRKPRSALKVPARRSLRNGSRKSGSPNVRPSVTLSSSTFQSGRAVEVSDDFCFDRSAACSVSATEQNGAPISECRSPWRSRSNGTAARPTLAAAQERHRRAVFSIPRGMQERAAGCEALSECVQFRRLVLDPVVFSAFVAQRSAWIMASATKRPYRLGVQPRRSTRSS